MCDKNCSSKYNKDNLTGERFENKDLGDKIKDMGKHAKEEVKEGWDKLVGNTPEDRAATHVKKTADNCAKQMKNAREEAADKMRDTARHIEGH